MIPMRGLLDERDGLLRRARGAWTEREQLWPHATGWGNWLRRTASAVARRHSASGRGRSRRRGSRGRLPSSRAAAMTLVELLRGRSGLGCGKPPRADGPVPWPPCRRWQPVVPRRRRSSAKLKRLTVWTSTRPLPLGAEARDGRVRARPHVAGPCRGGCAGRPVPWAQVVRSAKSARRWTSSSSQRAAVGLPRIVEGLPEVAVDAPGSGPRCGTCRGGCGPRGDRGTRGSPPRSVVRMPSSRGRRAARNPPKGARTRCAAPGSTRTSHSLPGLIGSSWQPRSGLHSGGAAGRLGGFGPGGIYAWVGCRTSLKRNRLWRSVRISTTTLGVAAKFVLRPPCGNPGPGLGRAPPGARAPGSPGPPRSGSEA
jgi:hypothetical protein